MEVSDVIGELPARTRKVRLRFRDRLQRVASAHRRLGSENRRFVVADGRREVFKHLLPLVNRALKLRDTCCESVLDLAGRFLLLHRVMAVVHPAVVRGVN